MTNSLLPVSAVSLSNGRPMTLSQSVAEVFEKEHFNVLRDIDGLGCSAEFRRLNFEATFRAVPGPNGATRQERCFEMTKDGFTILAMGYTGAKAMAFNGGALGRTAPRSGTVIPVASASQFLMTEERGGSQPNPRTVL